MTQIANDKIDSKALQALPIIDPTDPNKKLSEKEEKHLREIRPFEFTNIEDPGLMHKFPYGNSSNKHTFTFMHGGTYRVPRFIARHIESRSTPMWGWKPDGTGSLEKSYKGRKSRFMMREVFE